MIWFFTRDSDRLTAETRFDNATGAYVLRLTWADGRTQTESFPNTSTFQQRLDALKEHLKAERWLQDGPPMLLRDGWRKGGGNDGTLH